MSVQDVLLFTMAFLFMRFNTSYVSVQASAVVSIKSVFICFNTSYVSVQVDDNNSKMIKIWFQYILCVGSSGSKDYTVMHYKSFNTSYVSVQGL